MFRLGFGNKVSCSPWLSLTDPTNAMVNLKLFEFRNEFDLLSKKMLNFRSKIIWKLNLNDFKRVI